MTVAASGSALRGAADHSHVAADPSLWPMASSACIAIVLHLQASVGLRTPRGLLTSKRSLRLRPHDLLLDLNPVNASVDVSASVSASVDVRPASQGQDTNTHTHAKRLRRHGLAQGCYKRLGGDVVRRVCCVTRRAACRCVHCGARTAPPAGLRLVFLRGGLCQRVGLRLIFAVRSLKGIRFVIFAVLREGNEARTCQAAGLLGAVMVSAVHACICQYDVTAAQLLLLGGEAQVRSKQSPHISVGMLPAPVSLLVERLEADVAVLSEAKPRFSFHHGHVMALLPRGSQQVSYQLTVTAVGSSAALWDLSLARSLSLSLLLFLSLSLSPSLSPSLALAFSLSLSLSPSLSLSLSLPLFHSRALALSRFCSRSLHTHNKHTYYYILWTPELVNRYRYTIRTTTCNSTRARRMLPTWCTRTPSRKCTFCHGRQTRHASRCR